MSIIVRCSDHSNSVLFYRISFKFYIKIALSNSHVSLNMGFVWRAITKMADNNGRRLSVSAVVVTLT